MNDDKFEPLSQEEVDEWLADSYLRHQLDSCAATLYRALRTIQQEREQMEAAIHQRHQQEVRAGRSLRSRGLFAVGAETMSDETKLRHDWAQKLNLGEGANSRNEGSRQVSAEERARRVRAATLRGWINTEEPYCTFPDDLADLIYREALQEIREAERRAATIEAKAWERVCENRERQARREALEEAAKLRCNLCLNGVRLERNEKDEWWHKDKADRWWCPCNASEFYALLDTPPKEGR